MLLKNLEARVRQICLGAEPDRVPGILGNYAAEFIQVLGQFCRWKTVVLGVVFLLKDDPIQARAENSHCRLIERLSENSRIEVGIILGKPRPSPEPPGNDYLRYSQQK
jgi:hypothetical protein